LRSTKNIALVLNTTCRIAAEEGGVHPFYLHQISEKYALLIERIHSLTDLYLLMKNMAIEYTQLVNTYSVREFSPIIGRSIQYIQLHLGTPFSLKQIAENSSMNPSYLSRLFKEETGISLTEYINQQRIRAAKNYLQLDTTTITEVAFMVGYNDVNYFIKRFKKIVGLTPTQYRKNFQTH
ncbi:MAG: AraC family transcriptional regulator, partial [Enterococcus aquimarinus]